MFELANYSFSVHALLFLVTGFIGVVFGVFIRLSSDERPHRSFFLLTIVIFLWLAGNAFEFSSLTPELAAWWGMVVWTGVIFIAPSAYGFTVAVLGLPKGRTLFWYAAFIPFLALLYGGFLLEGVRLFPWGYYNTAGPFLPLFFVFFGVCIGASIYLYIRTLRSGRLTGAKHKQVVVLLAGFVIALVGSLDFLPLVGVDLRPAGFLPVFAWIGLLAYALKRYGLFRITPEVALAAVLRTLPGALFVTDTRGGILSANPGASKMTGVGQGELAGKSVLAFVPFVREVLARAAGTAKDQTLIVAEEEAVLHSSQGQKVEVALSASVIRRNGDVVALSIFCSDITSLVRRSADLTAAVENVQRQNEQLELGKRAILNVLEDAEHEKAVSQRLAADLEKFRLAVEDTSDPILITDPTIRVLYANKAVERTTGFGREEIIGKSPLWWEQQVDSEFYKKLWQAVRVDHASFVGELLNRKSTGEQYLAEIRISPVLDPGGELQFLVYIERDITEQKKLEEARSSFISTASHQLRTPLTSMRWFSEMLLDGDVGKLKKPQQHYVERIYQGIERIIGLIDLLLQIARVEAGRVKVEPVAVDQWRLISDVMASLRERADRRRVKFAIDVSVGLPPVQLDQDIFWQVLLNLLNNAIIYSYEGGTVTVSVVHEKEKGRFLYSVRDEGIGIPEVQQGRIFQQFFRADNAVKYVPEGSGLGLNLAKRLIEGWGGVIWFESTEGKGTTFYFTVPESGMKPRQGEVRLSV